MSKRMQVLFDERELADIQRTARQEGMTTAEWVRRTLKRALRERPERARDQKIAAVRAAAANQFPAPDIDQMLEEIAHGRGTELPL